MDGGKGMSAQCVADKVAEILQETSRTGESVAMIEKRGTPDWYVIHALAEVYNRDPAEIAAAGIPKSRKRK
jgi:hypothetical protein